MRRDQADKSDIFMTLCDIPRLLSPSFRINHAALGGQFHAAATIIPSPLSLCTWGYVAHPMQSGTVNHVRDQPGSLSPRPLPLTYEKKDKGKVMNLQFLLIRT